MNSFNVVNLKIEKANVIKRFTCLRTIATLFRLIEIIFVIIILSRFSIQLPVKLSLSCEYLRRAYSAVFSPSFVFIIGNMIVVTLFLKSSRVSHANMPSNDFYKEHIVEKKERQVQFKTNVECATVIRPSQETNNIKAYPVVKQEKERKMIGRSKSGELRNAGVPNKQLRRSVTEVGRASKPEADEMSGEEFRQRVEDFIARQQRSLREDEFSATIGY